MRSKIFVLWLLALLALVSTPASAALPARPDGPIMDAAGIIPDQREAALDQKLRAYNRDTGRALIVATVGSLEGQEVDRYAQELARAWDIGGAESQEGVLLLVAPNERKIRIHTAVGAQGRLTDGFLANIIRNTMTPAFKAGDMAGGIEQGVDAVITQMNRDPTDAIAVAEAAEAARAQENRGGGVDVGTIIFLIFFFLFFVLPIIRAMRGGGARRRYGSGPVIIWGPSIGGGFGGGGGGFGGGGGSGGGFGGFGGGGGGFDGGGASGGW